MTSTKVSEHSFGRLPDGTEARLFTVQNSDVIVTLTTFGARVVSLLTKDRDGKLADISLGYEDANDYALQSNAFFGATIGRYGNRIARGQFELNGVRYQIPVNNGVNALHGGPHGFDLRNWKAHATDSGVEFMLTSEDGDQGFPGTLSVQASYTLHSDSLSLQYRAQTDKPTIINLTNHTYFNLAGEGQPSVLDHEITLLADYITGIDDTLIPTGEFLPVADTPFDFTSPRLLGERIEQPHAQLLRAKGYDHNFVIQGMAGDLRQAARARNLNNGRVLDVFTTQPGVQFYSGNFLDGSLTGKSGLPYGYRSAFCFETQHFPDSPNHSEFPSTTLRPGETYTSETVWKFGQH